MSAHALKATTRQAVFIPRVMPTLRTVAGFKIETGIPISEPQIVGRPKSPLRLALEALQVGESILASRKEYSNGRIKSLAKWMHIKVACRIVSETHRRIWRTQ